MGLQHATTFVNYVYTFELGYNIMKGIFCVVINECRYNRGEQGYG